jgi:hypothetical protein
MGSIRIDYFECASDNQIALGEIDPPLGTRIPPYDPEMDVTDQNDWNLQSN